VSAPLDDDAAIAKLDALISQAMEEAKREESRFYHADQSAIEIIKVGIATAAVLAAALSQANLDTVEIGLASAGVGVTLIATLCALFARLGPARFYCGSFRERREAANVARDNLLNAADAADSNPTDVRHRIHEFWRARAESFRFEADKKGRAHGLAIVILVVAVPPLATLAIRLVASL
jgi:hypothetical protein